MMIQTSDYTTATSPAQALSGPWPWYVLVIAGFAISGLFPWLMVAWALYQRGQRRIALLAVGLNLAVFAAFAWATLTVSFVWQYVLTATYLVNLLWSFSAWVGQKYLLGAAPKRYYLHEWRSWLTPLVIGALFGVCLSVLFTIVPALQQRNEVWQIGETLDRESLLWDFFAALPWGGLVGLLIGFWWAGERERFHSGQILTFLPAVAATALLWSVLGLLFLFLAHKGTLADMFDSSSSYWAVVPPWTHGVGRVLLRLQLLDVSALIVVPLGFGAVSRIRDFGKQMLLIPLAFVCLLPRMFSENAWWTMIQDQIFYEMCSPSPHARAVAHEWAERLLQRYPEHLRWPQIANAVAQYFYEHGEYDRARVLYQDMIDRYSGVNQWHWSVNLAREALAMPDFGISPSGPSLSVPVVDYEEYLSTAWMSVLSVIRYWEGAEIPESEIKIRLKDLSRNADRINLSSLDSLVDLDDAVHQLGYDMFILAADVARLENLIAAGFPVIARRYNRMAVVWGFEESRNVASQYSFDYLSSRVRHERPKETREILELEAEGQGESQERLTRISYEAYDEFSLTTWKNPILRYSGPVMAVVLPTDRITSVAAILGSPLEQIQQEHQGYLATLIGLSYVENSDPEHAIEWAKVGAQKLTDPLPWYVAHLAETLWLSRNQTVKSVLPLQQQFPELAQIFAYFAEPVNRTFLDQARQRFLQDLPQNTIPEMILRRYKSFLDTSNPDESAQMIRILQNGLAIDPEDYHAWRQLANLYERAGDTAGMVAALRGAIAMYPTNFEDKLRLAYGLVVLEQYADAQAVLNTIDVGRIAYNADYMFCRAAIVESEGKIKQALQYYASAIEMRRHSPIYHLKYGKLLLQQGQTTQAQKALEWAARIDASGTIKQEAERLLAGIVTQ